MDRELRVAARRRGTFRNRFWAVVLALVVSAWVFWIFAQRAVPSSLQGRAWFAALSIVSFLYCLFSGSQITADSLSGEKREGTLGLLFLTDLKGYDVIIGKLCATSLNAFYGLVAIVPILSLPLELGGITIIEVGKISLVLLNTLFFSLAAGIFISMISHDERKASFATMLLTVGVAVLPWLVVTMIETHWGQSAMETLLPILALSPAFGLAYVLSPVGIPVPPIAFWGSLAAINLLSCALLLIAARRLPRIWQDQAPRSWLGRLEAHIEQLSYGEDRLRRQHRSRLLAINPFLWLTGRDRWKSRYVWGLVIAVTGVWFWGYHEYETIMLEPNVMVPGLFLLNTFIKVWIASEASSRLVSDRRAGALELLLSTQLNPSDILRGQWLALRRQFGWPLLALVILEWLVLNSRFPQVDIVAFLAMLVLDIVALGWVGMWQGLKAKSTTRAMLRTVFAVLMMPWLFFLPAQAIATFLLAASSFVMNRAGQTELTFTTQVGLWFLIGLITDCGLGFFWARRNLIQRFRSAALPHYQTPKRARQRWGWPFGKTRDRLVLALESDLPTESADP